MMVLQELEEALYALAVMPQRHARTCRLQDDATLPEGGLAPLTVYTQEVHGKLLARFDELVFFVSQERYLDALFVVRAMLDMVAEKLGISSDPRKLTRAHAGHAVMQSMTLFRLHLLLMKYEAQIQSQLGNQRCARQGFEKVLEFDVSNRLGAHELLNGLS